MVIRILARDGIAELGVCWEEGRLSSAPGAAILRVREFSACTCLVL
jgi:hypothetical protein